MLARSTATSLRLRLDLVVLPVGAVEAGRARPLGLAFGECCMKWVAEQLRASAEPAGRPA